MKTLHSALLVAALTALPVTPTLAKGQLEDVTVSLGRQTVLPVRGLTRVAVGDPDVADVKIVGGRELLVTGLSTGATSMILWFGDRQEARQIRVQDLRKLEQMTETFDSLGIEGMKLMQIGDKVIVDGEVEDPITHARLQQVAAAFPYLVLMTRVSPDVYRQVASLINEALASAGIEGASASVVGTRIFLEGSVADEVELDRALKIVRAISATYGV